MKKWFLIFCIAFFAGQQIQCALIDLYQEHERATIFDISDKQLPKAIKDLQAHKPNLKYLDMSKNNLTSLPNGVFDTFTNLEFLDISLNKLQELPATIFRQLPNLEILLMSYNPLDRLPDDIFVHQNKLEQLSLICSSLEILPSSIQNLTSLQYITLPIYLIELAITFGCIDEYIPFHTGHTDEDSFPLQGKQIQKFVQHYFLHEQQPGLETDEFYIRQAMKKNKKSCIIRACLHFT